MWEMFFAKIKIIIIRLQTENYTIEIWPTLREKTYGKIRYYS